MSLTRSSLTWISDSDYSNIALNRPVSASSLEVGDGRFTAPMAVDGVVSKDSRVSFGKTADNQWLLVDLGSRKTVSEFVINYESSPPAFKIQVSTDGVNYQDVYEAADLPDGRLSEDRTRVRISISDQGPGLKDVDTNNLFVRFYQGNNSRPGTGIGLSYSKILVEQHGGNIGAYDNKNFGSPGATFWFELPLNTEPGNITLHPQEYLNTLFPSEGWGA